MPRKRTGRPTGRKSAYQEAIDVQWLKNLLDGSIKLKDVMPVETVVTRKKLVDGKVEKFKEIQESFKNGKDALAYHILKGNDKMISKVLDKIVATKTDLTSGDEKLQPGGFIMIPEKEKE